MLKQQNSLINELSTSHLSHPPHSIQIISSYNKKGNLHRDYGQTMRRQPRRRVSVAARAARPWVTVDSTRERVRLMREVPFEQLRPEEQDELLDYSSDGGGQDDEHPHEAGRVEHQQDEQDLAVSDGVRGDDNNAGDRAAQPVDDGEPNKSGNTEQQQNERDPGMSERGDDNEAGGGAAEPVSDEIHNEQGEEGRVEVQARQDPARSEDQEQALDNGQERHVADDNNMWFQQLNLVVWWALGFLLARYFRDMMRGA
ncbi:hypothetical protein F4779DRAFT_610960 [Xylariaceae sp. FL0662B]|nr:hypothetical protein F4779DRAFT_610960 [Xylariaceae sp. FL0662B]